MAKFDMNTLKICGRGTEVTPALRERVREHVKEALEVMDVRVTSMEVILRHDAGHEEGKKCSCEMTMCVPKSTIRVQETGNDMYHAIDLAAAKLARRLRRYKTRLIDDSRKKTRRHGKKHRETFLEDVSDLILDGDREAGLVRDKELSLEPMTDADAMLRIDMLGHDFFLYMDAEDGNPSVIYRRHDGGYGILHGLPEETNNNEN